jgi:hypothetical protein
MHQGYDPSKSRNSIASTLGGIFLFAALHLLPLMVLARPTQQKESRPQSQPASGTKTTIDGPVTIQGTVETRNQPNAAEIEERRNAASKPWWQKSDWWTVIVAGLATVFAGAAFCAGAFQAVQARNAVEEARRAARNAEDVVRLTERADILVDGISFHPGSRLDGGDSSVAIAFKNFGRTRANNVRFDVRLIIPDAPNEPTVLGPMILAAGDSQTVAFQPFIEFTTNKRSTM